jgi:hypothetical protein
MRPILLLLVFARLLCAQHASEQETAAMLERARTAALTYSASLPDFLCTEVVKRYVDPRGDNRWQRLDTLTVKLSYSDGAEDYKLIQINGKPTTTDFLKTGGPTSTGEFGSLLLSLFHRDMQTEFHWKGWSTIRKQRAAVFTYKVEQEHSRFHVRYGTATDGPGDVVAAYYGELAVAPESGAVLRVTQHAVLPLNFPIRESSATVEYDYADVAGIRRLLPTHAEVTMGAGRYKSRNQVEFKDYRKFQTESSITFDK